ncbi:non-ribosomal peptide synthetase [Rugosimonospora africana]|uniref:Carrier domain-containing protein n=1 Tax=Rugosimonospora africana TaxID=556532 RepID=A0A8J3VV66_9ACTN|nr:non-ribosomal peptide synthetase [Rugosimonospora africana]GIH19614.1 hypothetical protein Raf01_77860 [Rugosimonospora africana]
MADARWSLLAAEAPVRPLGRREYAFWILSQLAPDSAVSNLTIAFRTGRALRWWPLHAAANHLLYRHPGLRTRFPQEAGVPVRHVSAATDTQVQVDVLPVAEADLPARVEELARRPFDLASDLPVRVTALTIDTGGSAVVLTTHHIVSDAVSLMILVRELAAAYDGFAADGRVPAELSAALPLREEPAAPAGDLQFWVEHLCGATPRAMELPWARPGPARPTFAGSTVMTTMSPDAVAALRTLRRDLRVTENLVLLSAFYLLLLRHGAGPDMVVGVPVTVRRDPGDATVGFGVSTLPLRVRLDRDSGFRQLTRQVRDAFLAGIAHSGASVEAILVELGHRSADWRAPLFRHLYNYRPWDESDVRVGGERPTFLDIPRGDSRLDIELTVIGGSSAPALLANYSTEIHDEADVRAMLARLERLVIAAAGDVDRPVGTLDARCAAERAVLERANDTAVPDGPAGTVFDHVHRVAREDPDAVAVVAESGQRSYAELVSAAEGFTQRLRAAGVRPGDIVGLALGRTPGMVAAILGIWGAGASYLPLDPAQPAVRLAFQVDDADARVIVVPGADPAWAAGRTVLTWADFASPTGAASPVAEPPSGDAPAYVIYTSGSTGRPKGVAVSHTNLANVVTGFARRLATTARSAVLWSTTVTFDISALELFLPLASGGRVVIADPTGPARGRELAELIDKHDVAVVQGTPTLWRAVLPELGGALRGRIVLCGGEPLAADLAAALLRTGCRLFNAYGPTETTIWSTVAEVTGEPVDPVPVGTPVANTSVFVADAYGEELPCGVPGELCIAGTGVSLGYLRRPGLTAERFGTDPVRGRFYRTGDVARWRHDGVLEVLGRTDRQVKLRGHRIELGEVESVLREHEQVTDAAALVSGDGHGEPALRVFVRAAPGAPVSDLPDRLWQYLRQRLPDYGLPSGIDIVAEFPTTANGKLDYHALGAMVPAGRGAARPAPAAEPAGDLDLTRRLVRLWREALARPDLDADDNFFLQGGHSLLAERLVGRVSQLSGRVVSVRAIFDHPTARGLATFLAARGGDDARR